MSLHHIIYRVTAIIAAALLVAACDDGRVYDSFAQVDMAEWSAQDTAYFDVPRQSAGQYALTLTVRSTGDYPYQNLALVVETTIVPRHLLQRDTVFCTLRDAAPQPLSQQGVSLSERSFGVRALQLQRGDSLHIAVRHVMRRNALPGISEVGLRLESQ